MRWWLVCHGPCSGCQLRSNCISRSCSFYMGRHRLQSLEIILTQITGKKNPQSDIWKWISNNLLGVQDWVWSPYRLTWRSPLTTREKGVGVCWAAQPCCERDAVISSLQVSKGIGYKVTIYYSSIPKVTRLTSVKLRFKPRPLHIQASLLISSWALFHFWKSHLGPSSLYTFSEL